MKIGVTGTRHGWTTAQQLRFKELILAYISRGQIDQFHHGDCKGVDEQACAVVTELLGPHILHSHPCDIARWRAHVPSGVVHEILPPLRRNRVIAHIVDLLFVIPRGAQTVRGGTWHTYRQAVQHQKHVTIIWPEGAILNKFPTRRWRQPLSP